MELHMGLCVRWFRGMDVVEIILLFRKDAKEFCKRMWESDKTRGKQSAKVLGQAKTNPRGIKRTRSCDFYLSHGTISTRWSGILKPAIKLRGPGGLATEYAFHCGTSLTIWSHPLSCCTRNLVWWDPYVPGTGSPSPPRRSAVGTGTGKRVG